MQDDHRTIAERSLPEHLGGHFGNVNRDPETLRYLADRHGVMTMLDVGCGPGGMLDEAAAMGITAYGVDGDWTAARHDPRIHTHDYTTGLYTIAPVDLIWCTEFVEHVAAEYQDNYLATFDAGRVLFLTAAPPGFPGWHHVNCRESVYWIDLLTARGWQQDTEATAWVREHGGHIFSRRQGLVFTK